MGEVIDMEALGIHDVEATPDDWTPEKEEAVNADREILTGETYIDPKHQRGKALVTGKVSDIWKQESRKLAHGEQAEFKLRCCPFRQHLPSKKGENAVLTVSKARVSITCFSDHDHDGKKTGKSGNPYTRWTWDAGIRTSKAPFERGDQVELGTDLANQLHTWDGPWGPVGITEDGTVRRYVGPVGHRDAHSHPKAGAWVVLDDDHLRNRAMEYAGRFVRTGNDKVKPISLSASAVDGIVKIAKAKVAGRPRSAILPAGKLPQHDERGKVLLAGGVAMSLPGLAYQKHSPHNMVFEEEVLPVAPHQGDPTVLLSVLDRAFRGDPDAGDKVAFIQEFLGACVTGTAVKHQRHALFVGVPGSGKSTVIEALASIFPESGVTAISPATWGRQFGIEALQFSRLNTVTELPSKRVLQSDIIKAVLTGDLVTADRKYEKPITFRPMAGHLIAANDLPPVDDRTDGFFRRWVVIEWSRKITEAEQDSTIKDKLLAERGQLLSWALEGYRRLLDNGSYTIPATHERMTTTWKESSNTALAYLNEMVEPSEDHTIKAANLYRTYKLWAENNGYKPVSNRVFGTEAAKLFDKKRTKHGVVYRANWTDAAFDDDDDSPHPIEQEIRAHLDHKPTPEDLEAYEATTNSYAAKHPDLFRQAVARL